MNRHDYVKLDAIGIATLVKDRFVSAEDILAAARNQITFANPFVNAVIATIEPGASAEDQSQQAFAGVPFLMKDIGAGVAGHVTSCASRFIAHLGVPCTADSELTHRFRSAGLRILGKTNLPELGFNVTTEPRLFGPTLNPWNLTHSTGGSSGGAAAAVASGMVPIAHATDGAGSIRIPAACCGLIGLKPSRGALPQGPDAADVYGGLVSEGVITRTVRDTALALDIMYGAEAGAPYAAPTQSGLFLAALDGPSRPLRIGISMQVPADVYLSDASREATEKAAGLLEQLGHYVAPIDLPLSEADLLTVRDIYRTHVCAQTAADLTALCRNGIRLPDETVMERINLAAARHGKAMPATDFLLMERQRHRLTRRMARLWDRCEILLTPALAAPAVELGAFPTDHDDVVLHVARMLRFSPFTALFNVTGEPAIMLPLLRLNGLPVGIQLAAGFGDDARLLRLSAELERARGSPSIDSVANAFR
jgi:amidase